MEGCMANRPRGDNRAQLDELGNGTGETGPDSAGQSGDLQQLSQIADATEESVEELADNDQAMNASAVEGIEYAAHHPERPSHTHIEYRRPGDLSPERGSRRRHIFRDANTLPA